MVAWFLLSSPIIHWILGLSSCDSPRFRRCFFGENESLTRPSTLKTSQMRPAWDTMFSRTSWNSSWNFEGRSEAGIKNGTQSVRGKKHQMEHNCKELDIVRYSRCIWEVVSSVIRNFIGMFFPYSFHALQAGYPSWDPRWGLAVFVMKVISPGLSPSL